MIYLLKNVNDGSIFYLLNKDQFIVGRKDCDFLISDDQSISRKHAILSIKDGKITLQDFGSKYGTLHNDNKMEPKVEIELKNKDEIQFGVMKSKYRLMQHTIVTTGTRLNSSQKIKLRNDLALIGGKYIENWTSDCTHLTVEEITLTVKVLHAIIDEKPIVKPAYWTQFAENVKKNLPPPDIDRYNRPPIAEALLNNIEFEHNPKRKSLFKGKLFVFSKELNKKQMEDIIRKAGGTSISWEKDPIPLNDIKSSPKEFIIIQTPDPIDDSSLNEVIKFFSKQGKRTIPLQEIAMSIVLCSCEKDCNPNFNRVEQVFPMSQPNEPTQNNALVPGTQSQCFAVKRYKEEDDEVQVIIPDTIETESVQFKMETTSEKLSEKNATDKQSLKRQPKNDLEENPFKKPKVDSINMPSTSNQSKVIKQETMGNFLSKSTPSQKRSVEPDESDDVTINESKSNKNVNPFAFLNKNKKSKVDMNVSGKHDNPFKSIKQVNNVSQISDENPFKISSGKKKRESEDDSSDLSTCKRKKDESSRNKIFSSTHLDNNPDKSVNFSKISRINGTTNSIWYSKDTISNTTDLKENITNNIDTEMQHFIDQFKDTVIVEVITELPKRPVIFGNALDERGQHSKGKHNFKRFVKVMPVRPQRIIIGRDNFVAVEPQSTEGIVDNRKHHQFSDDDASHILKMKKTPKKFLI